MLYSYVKKVGDTFEFLPNEGIEFNDVVYNPQFLDASTNEFLLSIGVYRTELLPPPENALDKDGTYYFNLRADGVVEYRPNYTVGVRVPESISMRQARLALLGAELLATVDSAIANGTDEAMKIEWEYAAEVRRDWASLIAMATSLGLTSEQLDTLFIQASSL